MHHTYILVLVLLIMHHCPPPVDTHICKAPSFMIQSRPFCNICFFYLGQTCLLHKKTYNNRGTLNNFSSQTSRGNPREIHQLRTSLSSDSTIKKVSAHFHISLNSTKPTSFITHLGFFYSATFSTTPSFIDFLLCLFSKNFHHQFKAAFLSS